MGRPGEVWRGSWGRTYGGTSPHVKVDMMGTLGALSATLMVLRKDGEAGDGYG